MKKILPIICLALFCVFGCGESYQVTTKKLVKISDNEGAIRYQIELPVDYDKSIDRAIKDGKYQWCVFDATNFPITHDTQYQGTVLVNFELLCFNKSMRRYQIYEELEKRGLRPANIFEFLAFTAQYRGAELDGVNIVPLGAISVGWIDGYGILMGPGSWYSKGEHKLQFGGGMSGFVDGAYYLVVKQEKEK